MGDIEEFFLNFLQRNQVVAIVILAVLAVRFLLRNCPKKYSYWLWGIVGVRMMFDLPLSSPFSLFHLLGIFEERAGSAAAAAQKVTPAGVQTPAAMPGQNLMDPAGKIAALQTGSDLAGHGQPVLTVLFFLWIAGIAVVLSYGAYSCIKCRKTVRTAVILNRQTGLQRGRVRECDRIPSPFVLGLIRPVIYIPFGMEEDTLQYILAHESCHIRRHDPLWKLIAFLLLAVYWWNPLVWAAFLCMVRDMEMSCDEAVIASLGYGAKKGYSASLLAFAVKRHPCSFAPVAFGEGDAERRIRNVLDFKKPRMWAAAALTVLVIVVATGCLTNQESAADQKTEENIAQWAQAFCERDTDVILKMTSEDAQKDLENQELLYGKNFGWSSPWPWEEDPEASCFQIRSVDTWAKTAEILYYAKVSDPHVTVWKETIHYANENDLFQVTGERLKVYDAIASGQEFDDAYPEGISGTAMDYLTNNMKDMMETLSGHVAGGSGKDPLQDPLQAARQLLNLSEDDSEVQLAVKDGTDTENGEDNAVSVKITFPQDGAVRQVKMVRPWDENGIWIPQDDTQGTAQ